MTLYHHQMNQSKLAFVDIGFLGIAVFSIALHNIIYAFTAFKEPFFFLLSLIALGMFFGVLVDIGLQKKEGVR